jgi:hypothetical protein
MKQFRVPGADVPHMPNNNKLLPTGNNPAILKPKQLGRPAAE